MSSGSGATRLKSQKRIQPVDLLASHKVFQFPARMFVSPGAGCTQTADRVHTAML